MALPHNVDGTWTNSPTYDAAELRRADAALFSSEGIASGLAVSVDGSDVLTITKGQVVISGEDAAAGTGVYRAGTAANVTGNLAARDATNSRIDLVVFRQYDTDVVPAHGAYKSTIEVIAGTPSATPAVPSLPDMAVELARVTVPRSGGGAASVDSSHRVSAVAVGAAPAQAGSASVALASATNGFTDVTFPEPFASVPTVVPGVKDSSVFVVSHSNVTTTGCRITIRDYQEVARTGTFTVTWIALGS